MELSPSIRGQLDGPTNKNSCDATPPHNEQLPLSSRRNQLPVKRIHGSPLMRHEHLARALVELMPIGKPPSGAAPVLPHAPKTFQGMAVVATMRRQAMPPTLLLPVCPCRRELFRPMDAPAVDDHDARLPRGPQRAIT
jgi:hypothetical protein